MREIICDEIQHYVGQRELVDWTRPDPLDPTRPGSTYWNVPVVFLREVTRSDYLAQFPHVREKLDGHPNRQFFWEVSVD